MDEFQTQERSDEELNQRASKIINMLSDLNYADKYKVVMSLHDSLVEVIKQEGGVIQVTDLDELQDIIDKK